MKLLYLILFLLMLQPVRAQEIDSIYVNLYTDSLKLNSYNYINVEGLFSDGTYLPLDSNDIIFTSSHGKFFGNSLWIDSTQTTEKVKIRVALRKDTNRCREISIYIKKKADDEPLMTNEEYLEKLRKERKKQKEKVI